MIKNTASLDWIEKQITDMTNLLVTWSSINSGTHHLEGLAKQTEAIFDVIDLLNPDERSLISLPGYQKVQSNGELAIQPVGQILKASKRKQAPIQVLLCGHVDTVFGQDHPFQQTKWLDDITLNGPGVADMKGGLIVMLYALMALERSKVSENLGWEILLTPDEEIGSLSSAPTLVGASKRAHFGLVYEPSMTPTGILAGARKGSGKFDVVVHGRSAHAGRDFFLGKNAITKMAHIIDDLDELNQNDRGLTLNIGQIQGGFAANIVPDLCLTHLDIRYEEQRDVEWITQQLRSIIQRHNVDEGFRVDLFGQITRPAKPLGEKTLKLFQCVKETGEQLGLNINWKKSGGCCDGNNLSANGLPVVDTLGVRGGSLHSDQEFMLIDSLVERAQVSALLLMKFASGEYVL